MFYWAYSNTDGIGYRFPSSHGEYKLGSYAKPYFHNPTSYGKLICHYNGLHESAESDQHNLIKLSVDLHLLTPQTCEL